MDFISGISKDQEKFAIDATVTLTVEEITNELGGEMTETLHDFVASKTGALLYDEASKLWCCGPAYIADMYKKEKSVGK